jgi:hypothetical protein
MLRVVWPRTHVWPSLLVQWDVERARNLCQRQGFGVAHLVYRHHAEHTLAHQVLCRAWPAPRALPGLPGSQRCLARRRRAVHRQPTGCLLLAVQLRRCFLPAHSTAFRTTRRQTQLPRGLKEHARACGAGHWGACTCASSRSFSAAAAAMSASVRSRSASAVALSASARSTSSRALAAASCCSATSTASSLPASSMSAPSSAASASITSCSASTTSSHSFDAWKDTGAPVS